MTTKNTKAFDHWVRNDFVAINTDLETIYREQDDPALITSAGSALREQLREEGTVLITELLHEGNTDEGFDAAFDLLGNVGFFMAACRRHEITLPERDRESTLPEASALALQIGASIGVTPRFATAHLTTHNTAINGVAKSFTSLQAERVFNEYNTRGILAYKRAAEALMRVKQVGATSCIAIDLFAVAEQALRDVITSNKVLANKLSIEDFFYHVRPYYKPHHVGKNVFRGANAGDFAGINVLDLMLGLCRADDPYYSQLLIEKLLYMMPEDQGILKDAMRRQSVLDELLASLNSAGVPKENYEAFLKVCKAHGQTAKQHHNLLVEKFIVGPAKTMNAKHLGSITASGPELKHMLAALERLRDLRCASYSDSYETAFSSIERIRAAL